MLTGGRLNLGGVTPEAIDAWSDAQGRLTEIEESRRTPNLIVAVPTAAQAEPLGLTLEALEQHLYDALVATVLDLQNAIIRMRDALEAVLHFERGRVLRIEAAGDAEELGAMFDAHTGAPRRISQISVGLNSFCGGRSADAGRRARG